MYIISYKKYHIRNELPVQVRCRIPGSLGLVHWDDPEGCYGQGGGRREGDSGLGTRVHLWQVHVDVWQNQLNIVK